MKPLSSTMRRAIEVALGGNGVLTHRPGCLWRGVKWPYDNSERFESRTIQALVDRGLARYSNWVEVGDGYDPLDPIEVTLTDKAETV